MTTSPPLELRGLTKAYRRRPIISGIDLTLAAGEAVGIVGPNGAGKSTLLGCITGNRLPDAGTIEVCGHDPFSDPAAVARCMGFVPEQPFLYGELTVAETLDFVTQARNLPRQPAAAEAGRLLDLMGIGDARGSLCRELSQGMGRKLAIAIALLHRPGVIILDEALNGVDSQSADRIFGELDSRRAAGAAILLSSHDLDLVARWCDRTIVLEVHPTQTD
jgi:ABC-2 type transport system ATP-binding protein